jgi:hypothetical protein
MSGGSERAALSRRTRPCATGRASPARRCP